MADSDTQNTDVQPINIPEKPIYSQHLTNSAAECTHKLEEIMQLCEEIRPTIRKVCTAKSWYYYQNDFRKFMDAVSLIEHDTYAAARYLTRIASANWKVYYDNLASANSLGNLESILDHLISEE